MFAWVRKLFNRPCRCDRCEYRPINRSKSPYVSHGLSMWVGLDGEIHYRAKSRFIG